MAVTSFSYDVFLSHNSNDKASVRHLAKRLKDAGLSVWFDEWIIKPGDIISLKVDEGLEQSRVLLLCISPHALASGWVALERTTAIHRDPTNAGRRFIPLLLADCELPDTLRRYKYVDFREASPAAFDELLDACHGEPESLRPTPQPGPKKKPAKTTTRKNRARQKPATQPDPARPREEAKPLYVLERVISGHEGWVHSAAISPDGTWAASGSEDHTVKIWNLQTGECRATLRGHRDDVISVAVTPDGKRILSASFDGTVRVWDAVPGRQLAKLEGHTDKVWSVVAVQDNARALSGGFDQTLRLWALASGECLKTIKCGTSSDGDVFGSAINLAGTRVLSGHRDGRVRLWNPATGECLATLNGHSGFVLSVQIAPDGRFAVSGSADRTVKVWHLEAGVCAGTLEGHEGWVESVAISHDGALIASTFKRLGPHVGLEVRCLLAGA